MGPDLRERESGDTERGTAPAPATRGAGTEPPRIRSFRRPRSAGARHGGTRGNDRNGGPTGEHEETPVRGGPRGTRTHRTGAFVSAQLSLRPLTRPWSSRDSAAWTSSSERSGWKDCQSSAERSLDDVHAALS